MLRVEKYRSIRSIPEDVWDSILSDHDVFNSHQFIGVVEEARVENATFWYMLFYDGVELKGHAVLSSFSISLDLFISSNTLIRGIKKILPDLFTVKILFCGLPVSLGQSNVKIENTTYEKEITELVACEMEKIAREEKITLMAAKEFNESDANQLAAFVVAGFFKAYSLPYMKMAVQWSTFTEYLECLRAPYRRAIKLSLLKSGGEPPKIYLANETHDDNHPVLVLGDISLLPAQDLFKMYLHVMDRTPTKLETLNLQFFQGLQRNYKSKMEVLTVQLHGEILSAGILLQNQDELTFMLVARKNAKDEAHSYFNLVYGIIGLAISRGLRLINLGQTAYWVKQRVGGKPVDLYIYFKSRRLFVNWVLRNLRNVIFPRLDFKKLAVFRKSGQKRLGRKTHFSYQ